MKRILVAYATNAGSTLEVAKAIGEVLAEAGFQVDVRALSEGPKLDGYEGVVVGGPMIMGWHRQARAFLRRHRQALERIPFAIFVMAMSLTDTGESEVDGTPAVVDPELPRRAARAGHLSFKERYACLSSYLRPVLHAARPARPVSVGVFGGRLEYGRLKWYAVMFVMVVLRAPAGDRRNWPAIRAWAEGLAKVLRPEGGEV